MLSCAASHLSSAAAVSGGLHQKPCASSTPSCRSALTAASVSTPLGHRAKTQSAGHVADGADDRLVPPVGVQILDEGAVDLDDVDLKFLQVGERGVAGAEVVDREPEAASRAVAQAGARSAVEQARLTDLQGHVSR